MKTGIFIKIDSGILKIVDELLKGLDGEAAENRSSFLNKLIFDRIMAAHMGGMAYLVKNAGIAAGRELTLEDLEDVFNGIKSTHSIAEIVRFGLMGD